MRVYVCCAKSLALVQNYKFCPFCGEEIQTGSYVEQCRKCFHMDAFGMCKKRNGLCHAINWKVNCTEYSPRSRISVLTNEVINIGTDEKVIEIDKDQAIQLIQKLKQFVERDD